MLKYETRKELEKMQYNDLKMMFELLFEEKEIKTFIIDCFCNFCNNDELIKKLIKVQEAEK